MEKQISVKELVDIFTEAKIQSEAELDQVNTLGLAPVGELEQKSFHQGKIHVLDGLIHAFSQYSIQGDSHSNTMESHLNIKKD